MHTSRLSLRIITAAFAVMICALYIALGSVPRAQALKHNARFANCKKLYGIDVSKWQTTIDWKKVKADGIDFATATDRRVRIVSTPTTIQTSRALRRQGSR